MTQETLVGYDHEKKEKEGERKKMKKKKKKWVVCSEVERDWN
jgi:ssRNA-specific RNase YbeY (16S rRNA maturation enzyme)